MKNNSTTAKLKLLSVFALKEETVEISASHIEVTKVYTGVGKARAAMGVTRAIMERRPDVVVNIGTAGTLSHQIGDVIVSTHFKDRDFETMKIPGVAYDLTVHNRLAESLPTIIGGKESRGVERLVSTGDDFVTSDCGIDADAFDMESFAEAMVCQEMGVPYVSIKFITDVIGQNSLQSWAARLREAREGLTEYFSKYLVALEDGYFNLYA